MPTVEEKLAQLSKPDILLKLFVFTAMLINPNSELQHYCSRCCGSTAKNRLSALKVINKGKYISIWMSTGRQRDDIGKHSEQ